MRAEGEVQYRATHRQELAVRLRPVVLCIVHADADAGVPWSPFHVCWALNPGRCGLSTGGDAPAAP
eukprot:362251-Chlamydomonas_euryale.AAC.4